MLTITIPNFKTEKSELDVIIADRTLLFDLLLRNNFVKTEIGFLKSRFASLVFWNNTYYFNFKYFNNKKLIDKIKKFLLNHFSDYKIDVRFHSNVIFYKYQKIYNSKRKINNKKILESKEDIMNNETNKKIFRNDLNKKTNENKVVLIEFKNESEKNFIKETKNKNEKINEFFENVYFKKLSNYTQEQIKNMFVDFVHEKNIFVFAKHENKYFNDLIDYLFRNFLENLNYVFIDNSKKN